MTGNTNNRSFHNSLRLKIPIHAIMDYPYQQVVQLRVWGQSQEPLIIKENNILKDITKGTDIGSSDRFL
jgi:hypothetical protein